MRKLKSRLGGSSSNLNTIIWASAGILIAGVVGVGAYEFQQNGTQHAGKSGDTFAQQLWGSSAPQTTVSIHGGTATLSKGAANSTTSVISFNSLSGSVQTGQQQIISGTVTENGQPLSGVSVSFSVSGGNLSSNSATTNSQGGFSVTYTAPNNTGTQTLTASVNGTQQTLSIPVSEVIPKITGLVFTGTAQNPTITVSGSGFGTFSNSLPWNGDSGDLVLHDNTGNWTMGSNGNLVTTNIQSWSNDQIVFKPGGAYGSYLLNSGDSVTVIVQPQGTQAASYASSVSYPAPIPSNITLQTGNMLSEGNSEQVSGQVTANGQPLANQTVSLSATGGTLSSSTVTTNSQGDFTSTYTAGGQTGNFVIEAQVGSLTATASVQVIPPAVITGITFSGTSQDPVITITGDNFGVFQNSLPWNGDSGDLVLHDNTGNWTMGSNGNLVTTDITSWSDQQIVFKPGGIGYGTAWTLNNGDSITTTVQNGKPYTSTVAYAAPIISINAAQTDLIAGQKTTVSGQVTAGGQPLANQTVNLTAAGGSFTQDSVTTNSQGDYSTSYTAPVILGVFPYGEQTAGNGGNLFAEQANGQNYIASPDGSAITSITVSYSGTQPAGWIYWYGQNGDLLSQTGLTMFGGAISAPSGTYFAAVQWGQGSTGAQLWVSNVTTSKGSYTDAQPNPLPSNTTSTPPTTPLSFPQSGTYTLSATSGNAKKSITVNVQGVNMNVSLSANQTSLAVGSSATLTATSSQSVTGTGNVINIYDETTGQWLPDVSSGTTNQQTVSESSASAQTYIAYVGPVDNSTADIAKSAPVSVTWVAPFTLYAATGNDGVVAWNGSNWNPVGTWSGYTDALTNIGNTLYAGTDTAGVQAWNGSSWASLGDPNSNAYVNALAQINGNLYAGTNGSGVAQWNGTSWTNLGKPSNQGTVYCLTNLNGVLYAGTANGGVAQWNGSSWTNLGNENWRILSLTSDGNTLYAGTLGEGVQAWNGSSWTSMGNPNGIATVTSLAVVNGKLYAGANNNGVAQWTGSQWLNIQSSGDALALTDENGTLVEGAGSGTETWNGSSWSALQPIDSGNGGNVYAFAEPSGLSYSVSPNVSGDANMSLSGAQAYAGDTVWMVPVGSTTYTYFAASTHQYPFSGYDITNGVIASNGFFWAQAHWLNPMNSALGFNDAYPIEIRNSANQVVWSSAAVGN